MKKVDKALSNSHRFPDGVAVGYAAILEEDKESY